jgi:hypothetical protein
MELKTAIEILEYHQEWRLGKRQDMIHEPKNLTEALDLLLWEVKKNSSEGKCNCNSRIGETMLWCCNQCGLRCEDF